MEFANEQHTKGEELYEEGKVRGRLRVAPGICGLATTPATLATPGGRVGEYLFWAVFLVVALCLLANWWRWLVAVVTVATIWLAYRDSERGEHFRHEVYRNKEVIWKRMLEAEMGKSGVDQGSVKKEAERGPAN